MSFEQPATPAGAGGRVGGTRPTQKAADAAAVEGEALRRRQLRAALCHGSDRSWRDRYRAWPSLIAGVIAVVLICAGIGVYGAFQKQQRLDQEEERKRQEQERRATAEPTQPNQPANTNQITTPPPSGGTSTP